MKGTKANQPSLVRNISPRAPFPDDLLSLLQRLQELHLQENSIKLLEDQALAGLSSLALLDLSRNQLGTISHETLQPLASLQVLRLTGTSSGARGLKQRYRATVLASGSRPSYVGQPYGSGSRAVRPQGSSEGPHHYQQPQQNAARNGGVGRGTAQRTFVRKTEKVQVSKQSRHS